MDILQYWFMGMLLKRGWTKLLIRNLLGDPDALEWVLGHREPTHWYLVERVLRAEQSPEFLTHKALHETRRAAGRSRAKASCEATLEYARTARIRLRPLDSATLHRRCQHAHRAKQAHAARTLVMYARWKISYVRERLSNEVKLMASLHHRPGADKARWLLRHRILDAIAAQYPELAETCAALQNERFERV